MNFRLAASALVLCLASYTCCADTVTFDSSSDLTTYFASTGSTKYSVVNGVGLSASSGTAVDSATTSQTLTTRASESGGGSANPSFSTSFYFHYSAPTSSAGGNMLMLGLANLANFDSTSTSRADIEFNLSKTAFSAQYSAVTGSYSGSGGSANSTQVSLTDGSWYKMTLNAAYNSTRAVYDAQCVLSLSSSSGVVGTTVFSQLAPSFTNINPNQPIYAFLASQGPAGSMGVAAIDNFSFSATQVPEPSALGLIVFGVLGTMIRKCKQVAKMKRVVAGKL